MLENKRILVTGVTGFIGAHLVKFLSNTFKCHFIYGISKTQLNQDNMYQVDIGDPEQLEKIVLKVNPNVIFHLASNIKPSRDIIDLDNMLHTNIMGTVNLLSIIQKNKLSVDFLINFGSCEEYGYNTTLPFTEDLLPSPVSIYSGTKAASTALCKMFYNIYKIPIITVRPSLVYGPNQSDRFFISQSIKKLINNEDFDMTEGLQTRDFIYIEDVLTALVEIMYNRDYFLGEVVNISSGINYSLLEVVKIIHSLLCSESRLNIGSIPYRSNEIMNFNCSNQKLVNHTSWRPHYSIEQGLLKTIEFYRKAK